MKYVEFINSFQYFLLLSYDRGYNDDKANAIINEALGNLGLINFAKCPQLPNNLWLMKAKGEKPVTNGEDEIEILSAFQRSFQNELREVISKSDEQQYRVHDITEKLFAVILRSLNEPMALHKMGDTYPVLSLEKIWDSRKIKQE